jgi:hypothetical protein
VKAITTRARVTFPLNARLDIIVWWVGFTQGPSVVIDIDAQDNPSASGSVVRGLDPPASSRHQATLLVKGTISIRHRV